MTKLAKTEPKPGVSLGAAQKLVVDISAEIQETDAKKKKLQAEEALLEFEHRQGDQTALERQKELFPKIAELDNRLETLRRTLKDHAEPQLEALTHAEFLKQEKSRWAETRVATEKTYALCLDFMKTVERLEDLREKIIDGSTRCYALAPRRDAVYAESLLSPNRVSNEMKNFIHKLTGWSFHNQTLLSRYELPPFDAQMKNAFNWVLKLEGTDHEDWGTKGVPTDPVAAREREKAEERRMTEDLYKYRAEQQKIAVEQELLRQADIEEQHRRDTRKNINRTVKMEQRR